MIDSQIVPQQLINVGDTVELKFPYRKELNQALLVREDGVITPPLIAPVMAVGKTPEQLRCELAYFYELQSYNPALSRLDAARKKYLISAGDVLDIKFDFHPENDDRVTVRPDGKIALSRVKTIVAEGKSPEELQEELVVLYKPFFQDASLVVSVREFTSDLVYIDDKPFRLGFKNVDQINLTVVRPVPQQVYVTGEVNTPGFFAYRAPMTLARAVIMAGGHKRTAKLQSVIVLRKIGDQPPVVLCVNLRPELTGNETTDIPLRPYDIVVVPKTSIAKVQDILDQYLYDLIPVTKNSAFLILTTLNPSQAVVNPTSLAH